MPVILLRNCTKRTQSGTAIEENIVWVAKKKKKKSPPWHILVQCEKIKKVINKNRFWMKSVPGKLREQNVPNVRPANLYLGKCSLLMQTALFLLAGLSM